MKKILINDILKLDSSEFSNVRIKFNIYNGENDPLNVYKNNPEDINSIWFLWKKLKRNFCKGQIAICLVRIESDIWLMTTIKRITEELNVIDDVGYVAEEVINYKKYFGLVLLRFHNTCQNMVRKYESVMNDVEVEKILDRQFIKSDFFKL